MDGFGSVINQEGQGGGPFALRGATDRATLGPSV